MVAETSMKLDRYSFGDDESVSRKRARIRKPARVAETIMVLWIHHDPKGFMQA